MPGLFESIRGWVAQPFQGPDEMDLGEWAAFTVVIVTIAFLWHRGVLRAIYANAD